YMSDRCQSWSPGNERLRQLLLVRPDARARRKVETFLSCHCKGSGSRESHTPCTPEHDRRPASRQEALTMTQASSVQPPRVAVWLLDLFTHYEQTESIPGDLLEEFSAVASRSGVA